MLKNDNKLISLINQFTPLVCWKVGLIYGSMLYFDINDRIEHIDKKGHKYTYGSARLYLDGDNWSIYHNGIKVIDSSSVNRTIAESILHQKFFGQELTKIILLFNQ